MMIIKLSKKITNNFITLSMIDSSALLKRLRVSSTNAPLQQSSRLAQIKLAKLIYNNRHIRDIRKFLREEQAILMKSKQVNEERKPATEKSNQKGRYDDNQLKELSYEFQSVRARYVVQIDEKKALQSIYSISNNTKRRESIRKRPTEMSKQTFKKNTARNGHLSLLPLNRMKSISFSSNKQKPISPMKQPLSPLRLRDRVNHNMEIQEVKISLKDQQITLALNSLINLINTKESKNFIIPRQLIFDLISKKYKLSPQNSASKQPSNDFLMALINTSLEPQTNFHVQLPFCQFVSLKDSRKSIQRIFNMTLKAAQRIAFKIYDRNDNGIIDQKDIIELFTVAEQFPAMQEDMEIIVKNYKISPSLSKESGEGLSRQRANSRFPKRFMTYADQSDLSIDKLNKFDVIDERIERNQYQSKKFNKQTFFTFKQTKKEFFKKKVSNSASISLSWTDFQLAFKNTRPQIFYDLLDYLFNINSLQIFEKANKLAYQQDKKSYRIMVFNNSDGKSQVGSNYNKVENEEQLTKRQKKSDSGSNKKEDGKKLKSQRKNPSKSSNRSEKPQNVQNLIDRVRLIDQFQSVKYL